MQSVRNRIPAVSKFEPSKTHLADKLPDLMKNQNRRSNERPRKGIEKLPYAVQARQLLHFAKMQLPFLKKPKFMFTSLGVHKESKQKDIWV